MPPGRHAIVSHGQRAAPRVAGDAPPWPRHRPARSRRCGRGEHAIAPSGLRISRDEPAIVHLSPRHPSTQVRQVHRCATDTAATHSDPCSSASALCFMAKQRAPANQGPHRCDRLTGRLDHRSCIGLQGTRTVRTAHRAHPSKALHRTTQRSSERSTRNGLCEHPVTPRVRRVAPKNGRPCCSPSATGRWIAVNRLFGPSEVDCEVDRRPAIPIQETHT